MHYVRTVSKKFENACNNHLSLDLCLRKTQAVKSRDYRDVTVFEKFRFQNVFRPHVNE